MGVGLWHNPRTDKAFSLGYDTHERWIKSDENAVALGLSKSAMDVIATKSPKKYV